MGFVYLIQAGEFHKIGRTSIDPRKRLADLQVGCPLPLVLDCYLEHDEAVAFERALHRCFGPERVLGEWFRMSKESVNQLRAMAVWVRPETTEERHARYKTGNR